jgi:hypothetical protein
MFVSNSSLMFEPNKRLSLFAFFVQSKTYIRPERPSLFVGRTTDEEKDNIETNRPGNTN